MNYNNLAYLKKSTDLDLYTLGYNYQHGMGVEKNERKAFIYYQKSVDTGDAEGTFMIGYCYRNGIGIEKDEHKAFIYYQKSAEMGHVIGTYNVGRCYKNGIGVRKDEHKAFSYYQKSAEMGCASGTYDIGSCYLYGTGVFEDQKKAFEYFQKAMEMGHAAAILQFADCYRNGIGIHQDIHRANYWYRIEKDVNRINKSSYENIDDNLKKILDDERYQLLWIPYNEFNYIKEIGKGGFSTVYRTSWAKKQVALKLIHGSNTLNQEFINELKAYCEIGYVNPSFLKCYGVSRDDTSRDYIIVLKYVSKGPLRQNLDSVAQMKWKDKLNLLYCIASDLVSIHSLELIHRDLHSGNILQDHLHSAYITDLGRSKSLKMNKEEELCGVLPFIAPEVLLSQPFTQSADIYSFGIIMYEISNGRIVFDGEPFNEILALKIVEGKRPVFDERTPECYVKLAKRCMDENQNQRPTANAICSKICHWLDEMNQNDNNGIKEQFLEADKNKINIDPSRHLNKEFDIICTRRYITQDILDRSLKLSESSDEELG